MGALLALAGYLGHASPRGDQANWGYSAATPPDRPASASLLISSAMISVSPASTPSRASRAISAGSDLAALRPGPCRCPCSRHAGADPGALPGQLQAQCVGQRPLGRLGRAVRAGAGKLTQASADRMFSTALCRCRASCGAKARVTASVPKKWVSISSRMSGPGPRSAARTRSRSPHCRSGWTRRGPRRRGGHRRGVGQVQRDRGDARQVHRRRVARGGVDGSAAVPQLERPNGGQVRGWPRSRARRSADLHDVSSALAPELVFPT